MPSRLPDFIIRILAEGTATEKRLEVEEVRRKASALAAKMPAPPHRQVYVGNLLRGALRGELDVEVFKAFVKATNTYQEVEACYPRAKFLMRKKSE